ncbi:MAG: hypothetical protein ACKO0M_16125 [Cyanobium sp.]
MSARKQLSMVLPEALIRAIKERATARGQTITAYICALVQRDLSADPNSAESAPSTALHERLQQLEQRVMKLEEQAM